MRDVILTNKPATIVVYEDDAALTLEPLSLTRPVWELCCGLTTLREKISRAFPDSQMLFHPRFYLSGIVDNLYISEKHLGGDLLWVNGALIPGEEVDSLADTPQNSAAVSNGRIMAFRGNPPSDWQAGTLVPIEGFHRVEVSAEVGMLARYLWDLIYAMNGENTKEARNLRYFGEIRGNVHQKAALIKAEEIFVSDGCEIAPGAVIDATFGPIVLAQDVIIGANAVVEGPVVIGAGTQIKPLSHVRGSCIGEQCRVGGEVSVSILQGYTNKQHGGFLGHSYIGSWCNLGSGTETSNLKNNYTPVKVQVGSQLVDTGKLFAGLFMGDHSKSAIGTIFNTGTVVGVGSIVFGAGFPPRYIPSFHWGGAEKLNPYPLKPTLETAREMMLRRGKNLSEEEIHILRWIHANRKS